MEHTPFISGIDDADLLSVVEGASLPPERAAAVREALGRDPRLAELVASMRADRELLAAHALSAAPADLLDRVEIVLEREALVGLAHTEAAVHPDRLPTSAVVPMRRPWLGVRAVAGFSAAAAIALIAGGVLILTSGGKPVVRPNLAGGTAGTGTPMDAGAVGGSTPSTVLAGGSTVSGDHLLIGAGTAERVVALGTEDRSTIEMSPMVMAASEEPATGASIAGPAMAELLDAARQGRLALTLRTSSDQAAAARVRAVAVNTRQVHVQRVDPALSAGLTGAIASAWQPATLLEPVSPIKPTSPQPVADVHGASDRVPQVPLGERPGRTAPRETSTEPAPVYSGQVFVAAVPSSVEGLEQLIRALSSETVPASWQVVPRPLVVDAPSDTGSILWWTAPASTWTDRVSIPIVVRNN